MSADRTDPSADARWSINDYTFAYQPIVDLESRSVWGYEALVRGPDNEPALQVLEQFSFDELHRFSIEAPARAVDTASRLGYHDRLTLNMVSSSLEIAADPFGPTLAAAESAGLAAELLTFELSEKDEVHDMDAFRKAVNPARRVGSGFALDDFGAGYGGLNLLADFQPNFIKIDIVLVNEIWRNGPRQAIVRGVLRTCLDLGIEVIAEGVEQAEEFVWLWNAGVRLFQGYLFARPAFEAFTAPVYPAID